MKLQHNKTPNQQMHYSVRERYSKKYETDVLGLDNQIKKSFKIPYIINNIKEGVILELERSGKKILLAVVIDRLHSSIKTKNINDKAWFLVLLSTTKTSSLDVVLEKDEDFNLQYRQSKNQRYFAIINNKGTTTYTADDLLKYNITLLPYIISYDERKQIGEALFEVNKRAKAMLLNQRKFTESKRRNAGHKNTQLINIIKNKYPDLKEKIEKGGVIKMQAIIEGERRIKVDKYKKKQDDARRSRSRSGKKTNNFEYYKIGGARGRGGVIKVDHDKLRKNLLIARNKHLKDQDNPGAKPTRPKKEN